MKLLLLYIIIIVEVFNDLNQVGVNVIKPYSRPKGSMPYSIKRLLKNNKYVIEGLLMLEDLSHNILRLKICSVAMRPVRKPACSSAMIYSA